MSKKILVAGCGLVGLEAALLLKKYVKDQANIVVINDKEFFEFKPWRNIVFRDGIQKDSQINLRSVLSGKGIGFVKGTVMGIDLQNKQVKFRGGTENFDFLVLSLGSVINYSIPGSAENALSYSTIKDSAVIKNHILKTLGEANVLKGKERDSALTIVVCGGGHSGVELTCELNDFLDRCCQEKNVRRIDIKLVLLEKQPQILSSFPSKARSYAFETMTRNGIDVRVSTRISEIGKDNVILGDSTHISSKTIIWCGGCNPNPILKGSELKLDSHKAVLVNTYMQTSEATVYAGGELASGRGMTTSSPDVASVSSSIEQANIIAYNIATNIMGGDKKEYKHTKMKTMLGLGHKNSMIIRGKSVMKGGIANSIKNMKENSHFKRLNK